MSLAIISFLAGILTVLAPCTLPTLPLILRGSESRRWYRPVAIIGSLVVSVGAVTLLIKSSTSLLEVSDLTLRIVSGIILLLFGVFSVFPDLWERISNRLNMSKESQTILNKSATKQTIAGDIITGSALGLVFSSCSPTYLIILSTVLPQSNSEGIFYLFLYLLGLGLILTLIVVFGQKITQKLSKANSSTFKKATGVLFILFGLMIIVGLDKDFEAWLLDNTLLGDISNWERGQVEATLE